MRILAALFSFSLALAAPAQAGAHQSWLLTTDLWGNASYDALDFDDQAGKLSGTLGGDPIDGTMSAAKIRFSVGKAPSRCRYEGTLARDKIEGVADCVDHNRADARVKHAFHARRLPDRPPGPPRRHEFRPSDYANEFSPHRMPVLTIWSGDSVHTTTVDSGGVDENGMTRALFGNPQTGPFFVAGAAPGDTLAIRILRLRPNRDYADSLDAIVGRALSLGVAAKAGDLGKPVRWKLDRERGMARPDTPSARLQDLQVPLRPMLGGLAVAPGFGSAPISTGDTGRFGGNMDFNEVVEGNTVYLPVFQPGALLYLGDAHALQGDGETSQYALETSMDVEFAVEVIHGKSIAMPRVESPDQIMVLGQAGSLDEAVRAATAGLAQWLEQDYGLNLSESAQVLGSSAHYVVANLAGRSVGIAAKLDKARLAALAPRGT